MGAQKKEDKFILQRFSFMKISVIILMITIFTSVFVTIPQLQAKKDDDKEAGKSFYEMASAACAWYNNSQQPKENGSDAIKNVAIGDAGGLVSYLDKDTPGFKGLFRNVLATSSASSNTYQSLLNVSCGDGAHTNSLYYYARYGHLLKSLGLDGTGKEGFGPRFIIGAPMWFFFVLAQSLPVIFKGILDMLKTLNIFSLLAKGYNKSATVDATVKVMKMSGAGKGNPLSSVITAISDVYNELFSIGWEITIPACIAIFLIGLFLLRDNKHMSRLKKIALRVLMITFGVPICGGIYTSALDALSDGVSGGIDGVSSLVSGTFCNFEGWVENARLAVPKDAVLESQGTAEGLAGEASVTSFQNLRKTCVAINKLANSDTSTLTTVDWNNSTLSEKKGSGSENEDTVVNSLDLINRYMRASTYDSAAFESSTKSWITDMTSKYNDDSKKVSCYADFMDEIMNNSLEADQFWNGKDNSVKGKDAKKAAQNRFNEPDRWNKVDTAEGKLSVNFWNNGNLAASTNNGDLGSKKNSIRLSKKTNLEEEKIKNPANKITFTSPEEITGTGSNISSLGGLSTMAMYNYLNSEFSKADVKVYSPTRSSSWYTKPTHFSVNLIGGSLSWAYWLNTLVILISITLVGYVYAVGMLNGSFRASLEILQNIPWMLFGSIRGGVRVLVLTFALIIEFAGTMFLYLVVSKFIMAIGTVADQDFYNIYLDGTVLLGVKASSPVSFLQNSVVIVVLKLVLSSVIIIALTWNGLKARRGFVKGMRDLIERALEKLLLEDGQGTGACRPLDRSGAFDNALKGMASGFGAATGKGKAPGKSIASADSAKNSGITPDEKDSIDPNKEDQNRLAQKGSEALLDSREGNDKDTGDNDTLPGPTGNREALPGPNNLLSGPAGENDPDLDPSMGGNRTQQTVDKNIANRLKNADKLDDIGKVDENGNFVSYSNDKNVAPTSENNAGYEDADYKVVDDGKKVTVPEAEQNNRTENREQKSLSANRDTNILQKGKNSALKGVQAANQYRKDHSYKTSKPAAYFKYDKNAAMQDGIVLSRNSKSFVDTKMQGKNVQSVKDVGACYQMMRGQGGGKIKNYNGCTAKKKGDDIIITQKMKAGGNAEYTVDAASGTIKERRLSASYMEKRYAPKKDVKKRS